MAQGFTTGSSRGGYTLSQVTLSVDSSNASDLPLVEIRESNSSNEPGMLVATLTNPATIDDSSTNSENIFSAPLGGGGVMLDPTTTYFVVAGYGANSANRFVLNVKVADDETGASGWSIANDRLAKQFYTTASWTVRVESALLKIEGTVNTFTITAPTASNNTVRAIAGTAYAFTADDFGFADADGDTLASVKIESLPGAGTLALDGTAVMASDVIPKADIDAGDLTFTPASGASGTGYASFTFKVNAGTDDSATAYTMTIDIRNIACGTPSFGDRREIWTGTVTVGVYTGLFGNSIYGYSAGASTGALDVDEFTIGSMDYEIATLTAGGGFLIFGLPAGGDRWRDEAIVNVLRLHVCDANYDFSASHWTLDFSVDPAGEIVPAHDWTTSLDWSAEGRSDCECAPAACLRRELRLQRFPLDT